MTMEPTQEELEAVTRIFEHEGYPLADAARHWWDAIAPMVLERAARVCRKSAHRDWVKLHGSTAERAETLRLGALSVVAELDEMLDELRSLKGAP